VNKKKSILPIAVLLGLILGGQIQANLNKYTVGDNDGFGSGTAVVPGDNIYGFGSMDADGTDGLIIGASDPHSYTFHYGPFSSITASSLFVQYADWPESHPGVLWIDDQETFFTFPALTPWQQHAPWTVLGVTIDLMPYVTYLNSDQATFSFVGGAADAYSIDYLQLSIDGVLAPHLPGPPSAPDPPVGHLPIPGAVLLGVIGLSCAGWRLGRGGT
jgi:hypothetical protein